MRKENGKGRSSRNKGIRFQGLVRKQIQEATNIPFITHSTELADIYPKDSGFGYIFECKNRRDFTPGSLFTMSWVIDAYTKVSEEAKLTQRKGILIVKGTRTGVWAIMAAGIFIRLFISEKTVSPSHSIHHGLVMMPFEELLNGLKENQQNKQ